VLESSLCDRYVVVDGTKEGTVQDYPARTSRSVRPGLRLAPRDSEVVYIWEDLVLSDSAVQGIAARASRVGYLGCADSPVSIRVETSHPNGNGMTTAWVSDPSGTESLPVPFEGLLEVLDIAYERFTSGELVRRSWFASRRARYRPPGEAGSDPGIDAAPTVVWLRLEPPVPGRKVVAVTETLRAAVLAKYERYVAGSAEGVPQILHGHGFDGAGYQHACWLALPDVGYPRSKGRIHGAAIWLPPGTPAAVIEGVRTSLRHVQDLVRPGYFRASLRSHSGERKPLAASPDRWVGPSSVWTTAFPVVHERWQAGGPDLASVARWCSNAGLPEPIAFRSATVPLQPGAVSLMAHETHRKGKEFRPYSHVEVSFDEPVAGPVVIGRSRQFGLGLMAPVGPTTAPGSAR
jgi:CRISPR-associated protein Csb2